MRYQRSTSFEPRSKIVQNCDKSRAKAKKYISNQLSMYSGMRCERLELPRLVYKTSILPTKLTALISEHSHSKKIGIFYFEN